MNPASLTDYQSGVLSSGNIETSGCQWNTPKKMTEFLLGYTIHVWINPYHSLGYKYTCIYIHHITSFLLGYMILYIHIYIHLISSHSFSLYPHWLSCFVNKKCVVNKSHSSLYPNSNMGLSWFVYKLGYSTTPNLKVNHTSHWTNHLLMVQHIHKHTQLIEKSPCTLW